MKEFDFVKFTLVLALLLTAACLGGWVWVGYSVDAKTRDLAQMKRYLAEIGETSSELRILQEERDRDEVKGTADESVFTFLYACARYAGMSRTDFKIAPSDSRVNDRDGYQDTKFAVDSLPDRETFRRNIFAYIFNVEAKSPRVKSVKIRLQLDPREAKQDRWKWNVIFLKRDPLAALQE